MKPGSVFGGHSNLAKRELIEFQNALNALSNSEFESLAAITLEAAGCSQVWCTPESHDQGIDAFGYCNFFDRRGGTWTGAQPRVAFLAQAKHYGECKASTKEIREFVGSYALSLHKIYSTVDQRYKDLELLPYGPTALIFITTEEVPGTVKRLASRAGVVVLSSDDLFDVLVSTLPKRPHMITSQWLIDIWGEKMKNLRKAN